MMVSNSVLLTDPTCSRRGARCSVEVISTMCGRMASQPSSSLTMNTEIEAETSDEADSPRSPRSPHPFNQAVGLLSDIGDFDILESLGEGFFCKVLKVRHKTSREVMVLKVCKISASGSRRAAHADAAREADMLRKLEHRHILKMRGICIERCGPEWDMHLLVDYCNGGSLSRYILDRSQHFPWMKRLRFALEISLAIEYIHSQKIIHRDLTSMNVLLRSDTTSGYTQTVVADFGLSCPFPKRGEKLPQVGTTYFMSPECLKEEFYDEKSDVFSFGVILCQLIARIDADPDSGLHRTSTFGLDYVLFTPCCPPDTPIELLKVAFNCCLLDPTYRPSFAEISSSLREIAPMMPASPQMSSRETRLGRSRSDAALKKPKGLALSGRKLSNTLATSYCRPVIEGMADDEASIAAMEELARGIAREEPSSHGHTNPFVVHERYRTERKIIPRGHTAGRRRSETKPEMTGRQPIKRWYRRRCTSLPAEMDSETITLAGGQEDEIDGSPGGIPMAFRDFDMKCSKTMKRFPSRRHTMIPECSGIKSTLELPSSLPFETSYRSKPIGLSPVREVFTDEMPATPLRLPPVPLSLSSSVSSFHSFNYPTNIGDQLNNNVKRTTKSSRRRASRVCTSSRGDQRRSNCVIL